MVSSRGPTRTVGRQAAQRNGFGKQPAPGRQIIRGCSFPGDEREHGCPGRRPHTAAPVGEATSLAGAMICRAGGRRTAGGRPGMLPAATALPTRTAGTARAATATAGRFQRDAKAEGLDVAIGTSADMVRGPTHGRQQRRQAGKAHPNCSADAAHTSSVLHYRCRVNPERSKPGCAVLRPTPRNSPRSAPAASPGRKRCSSRFARTGAGFTNGPSSTTCCRGTGWKFTGGLRPR
jgi:hypothetical protein